ncbi:MAG TPA: argininosuccinate lyase [Candidatus Bathyarchaeia archaeon]|nr:argininosuccinate lyase [Candidatus Bathyarchaeia archaeon]
MSKTLRGGRLSSKRNDVAEFTSSIKDDARLADAVIDINKAHVIMLMEQKIIKQQNAAKLLQALNTKLDLKMDASSEDVHMAVEEAVLKYVGPEVGGNLHIAKSRNDQVTTAIRMELRKKLIDLMLSVMQMQESLADTAEKHVETVILEYTHLQPAQPVTFAHYLLSRFDALKRDLQRLQGAYVRVNFCPMGAGALATTSFPINRKRVAELLGFDGLVENSIDAVGSRDFILETIAALTLTAVNLSQLAEDLIVWSSPDFGVVELPDDFTSTSSMMPQKKNPEVPEVIRARASHVLGDFVAAAAAMKGMPSTYNLDFQEVTPKLWEAVESVNSSLKMLAILVPELKVQSDVSEKGLKSLVAATELANMLVRKYNIPFRSAHTIVGALVKTLIESKQTFKNATPTLLAKVAKGTVGIFLAVNAGDIDESVDPKKIVESYNVTGGPAPTIVKKALVARKKSLAEAQSNINRLEQALEEAKKKLDSTTKSTSKADSEQNGKLKNSKR